MERLLILIAAVLMLLMVLFTTAFHKPRPASNLQTLSRVDPQDDWFRERVIQNPKTVLVDFSARWCGYCKQLHVQLEYLKKEFGDRLEVVTVDVDEHPNLSDAYHVSGLPTILIFKGGKIVEATTGAPGFDDLVRLVSPFVEPAPDEAAPREPAAAQPETVDTAK